MRLRRTTCVVLLLVTVVVLLLLWAWGPVGIRMLTGGPAVKVMISEETTHIVKPLRNDGYVDYVAALNEQLSQGVTPQNNMVVLFLKAIGPYNIEEGQRNRYFRLLGIPPLPEEGTTLRRSTDT